MKVSIVVPFYNEEESAGAVLQELREAQPDAEIIAINDGSSDKTHKVLESIPGIRAFHFPRNLGQSAAICFGLWQATGDYCVLLDGDGQNDPRDIGRLLSFLPDFDLVCGRRMVRRDTWSKRAASRWANRIRRSILKDGVSDTGCSLKAFHRRHVRHLVPFHGMHRYIPALFLKANLKITEVPVNHRPRNLGASKYTNLGRAWRGLRDLFGVSWLLSRAICWPAELEVPPDRRPE